jgi:hypothetical protein
VIFVTDKPTDWRALCVELVEKIDYTWGDIPEDVHELLDRARTALAQPEPEGEGVSNEDRQAIVVRLRELAFAVTEGPEALAREGTMSIPPRLLRDADIVLSTAADILARYARPTIKPVPVAERLPEAEGLTDEQWDAIKDRLWNNYETVGHQGERFMYQGDFDTALDVARQDLARYARPTIKPVPVAERLPEPGKKVLAHYLNALGKPRTIIAEWVPAKTREDSLDGDLGEYDDETDLFYWPEGWYEQIENWDDFTALLVDEGEITHWQPLPRGPHHALPVPQP